MACGCQPPGGWVVLVLALKVASASRLSVDNLDRTNSTNKFTCPNECLECCAASKVHIRVATLGVSRSKYKCVLKSSTTPSEYCDEVKTRRGSNQKKTKCKFRTSELSSQPWKHLKKTPCSKHTKCCCNIQDDWTESKCFDKQKTERYVQVPSQDSRAKGQVQTYEKSAQTYTNPGYCKGATALEYQTGPRASFSTHKRCCTETTRKKTVLKENCHLIAHSYVCEYNKVFWTACNSYESLYYCSEEGREHVQSGTHYKRISMAPGMCIGDQSTPESLKRIYGPGQYKGFKLSKKTCPTGYSTKITGRDCMCAEACGTT